MTEIICQHCQEKNEAGTDLCAACGRPLTATTTAGSGDDFDHMPRDKDEIERWLRQLPDWSISDAEQPVGDDESLPVWLLAVRAHADQLSDLEADELMDFLRELDPADAKATSEPAAEDVAVQAKMTAELPDWVAALAPQEQWPESEADEQLSQHFAEADEADEERLPSTAQLPGTRPLDTSIELDGIPEKLAGDELPDWLADQAAESGGPLTDVGPAWPARAPRLRPAPPAEPSAESPPPEPPPAAQGSEIEDELLEADGDDLALFSAGGADETTLDAEVEPAAPGEAAGYFDDSEASELEVALAGTLNLPHEAASQERVDQWLDILEDLPAPEDPDQLEQLVLDSDLDTVEVPEWLRALRPEQSGGEAKKPELGPPEQAGPLAGLRGIVPAAAISLTGGVDRTAVRLEMSKEQRQQVALLRRLTSAEPEAAVAVDETGDTPYLTVRVILGLALLLVILLGWLLPGVEDLLPWQSEPTLPPAAEQAQGTIEANAGRTTLVAFDYTPAMAGELDSVAAALLAHLAANGSPVLTVSQIAAGLPMAERATAAVPDLDVSTLGYLPGEQTGLRVLGACLAESCDSLAGRELDATSQDALADVGLIIVLAADRESLVNWIEQVGTQSDILMLGGVTQALGPVARPYVASEQLSGLLLGFPDAAAYAEAEKSDVVSAEGLAGLTLAQWLVIGALLAGAVYFGAVAPAASAVTQVAKK